MDKNRSRDCKSIQRSEATYLYYTCFLSLTSWRVYATNPFYCSLRSPLLYINPIYFSLASLARSSQFKTPLQPEVTGGDSRDRMKSTPSISLRR